MQYRGSRALLFGLFVVLLAVSHASAQRRLITSKEYFDSLHIVDYARLPVRLTDTTEIIANGVVVKTIESTSDTPVAGRSHRFAKTTEGSDVSEVEQIWIGSVRYERKSGGAWTKFDVRRTDLSPPSGDRSALSRTGPQCNQFSVEPTSLDGKPMRLYELFWTESIDNELTFRLDRVWIGEDGLRYRRELSSGKLLPRDETSRSTVTWVYDPPDMKSVEAPLP